jgi:hypothetical protein
MADGRMSRPYLFMCAPPTPHTQRTHPPFLLSTRRDPHHLPSSSPQIWPGVWQARATSGEHKGGGGERPAATSREGRWRISRRVSSADLGGLRASASDPARWERQWWPRGARIQSGGNGRARPGSGGGSCGSTSSGSTRPPLSPSMTVAVRLNSERRWLLRVDPKWRRLDPEQPRLRASTLSAVVS